MLFTADTLPSFKCFSSNRQMALTVSRLLAMQRGLRQSRRLLCGRGARFCRYHSLLRAPHGRLHCRASQSPCLYAAGRGAARCRGARPRRRFAVNRPARCYPLPDSRLRYHVRDKWAPLPLLTIRSVFTYHQGAMVFSRNGWVPDILLNNPVQPTLEGTVLGPATRLHAARG